ncbi:hypothetical protein AUF78_07770, partial [archaeon 13_1_20CM_2_51_12]
KVAVFPGLTSIGIIIALFIWLDRKITARVQLRVGPLYASPLGGVLQSFADLIKFAFKELFIPRNADKFFFVAAPVLALIGGAGLVGLIPFTPEWQISNLELGLPAFLAFVTLSPMLILLAGWSANSKYPFIGGLRSLFQQTAYEIPLWLSAIGVVMMAGTMNLIGIVQAQSKPWNIFPGLSIPGWYIIPQALGALLFFITATAEMERIPFDLPEAEPEIIMGWQAEYPGFLFMSAAGASFVRLYAFSALFSVLYLGGWMGPAPVPALLWTAIKIIIVSSLIILLRATFHVLASSRAQDLIKGMPDIAFFGFAAVTVLGAILALESRDLVYGAVSLGVSFLGVASLFFLLDAAYIGVFQIAVYIGAVVILILFTVMLVGPAKGEGPTEFRRTALFIGILVAMMLGVGGALASPSAFSTNQPCTPECDLAQFSQSLLVTYSVQLAVLSLVFAAAVIGALTLAKSERGTA